MAGKGHAELCLVLWAAWDPIPAGVPLDEYERYVWPLAGLLRKAAPHQQLAARLRELRTDEIGLEPDDESDARAAHKLQDWYHWRVEDPDNAGLD